MKTSYYILFSLVFNSLFLVAQPTGAQELGSWQEITISNKLSEKYSFFGALTSWSYELPLKRSHLLSAIVGAQYHFNSKTSIGIGYAFGDIDSSFEINDVPHTKEHRILEQFGIKHKWHNISLSQRFRLEHRFLDYQTESILKHRWRYRFKSTIPINTTFFISIYDEIHFNLNPFEFQQNRVFSGIGMRLHKNIKAELGYARHSFSTKSFNRLSIQLNLKLDSTKLKT
ncbi:DUF2490 domain-containing protein [Winogradskyella eckloniae]|uniref:DUF2490 domain-containing protein n=1 Tax=Winogradskyella eckloniae TaxID=1089306 RepID=UPI0015655B0E|nr:DUF2490 domain-containing protein [Winogradskyella eckloniae]NRD19908.1 DUF2490 domain-containing protein [Winogradskyella eckloniae]